MVKWFGSVLTSLAVAIFGFSGAIAQDRDDGHNKVRQHYRQHHHRKHHKHHHRSHLYRHHHHTKQSEKSDK